MGHCIQAIVGASDVADAISVRFPQLPRVSTSAGFAIFPVDEVFVDSVAQAIPQNTGAEFMLLTEGFREVLRSLSSLGTIAYIETDYFGGVGGQGAVVYSNGAEVMAPTWAEFGVINDALKRIGVPAPLGRSRFSIRALFQYRPKDRFEVFGLQRFRLNEDLVEAAGVADRN